MTEALRTWLAGLGFERHYARFAEEDIDLQALADLDAADLETLGVETLGQRKKLLRAIAALQSPAATEGDAIPPPRETERRIVSVFFCDLVGSTALAEALDPEDLRDVLAAYQNAVAEACGRFGGHVARFAGDGVLAYFGWPKGQEDHAERAARAGLSAVAAVAALKAGAKGPLAARVGVATGSVVIGDLVGPRAHDPQSVTGRTPNLASRLQSHAAPGGVVVCAATAELIGKALALRPLGPHAMRGFAEAVEVWEALGDGGAESRFKARTRPRTPFVGRQHELGLLRERWRVAQEGEGQAVVVRGEAGVGKSRLVETFLSSLATSGGERPRVLRYQCSPFHSDSAYYPIFDHIARAAGLAAGDNEVTRLDKLATLFGSARDGSAPQDIRAIAHMMGLAEAHRSGSAASPQQRRADANEILIGRLLSLAREAPTVVLFEDVHWIDPSSEALIGELLVDWADEAGMLIFTTRPDRETAWQASGAVAHLHLNRLSRRETGAIVAALTDRAADDPLACAVAERAGGIPLFAEELAVGLALGDVAANAIPKTLEGSLVARLDRLGPPKRVVQLAAAIGRSFEPDLLAELAGVGRAELERDLAAVVEAGLLWRSGTPPDVAYRFRHALVQDAAYATLLRSRREATHARIGALLETRQSATGIRAPEVAARHLSLGKRYERSVRQWMLAGQQATERSAYREAIAHLRNGLADLERLPVSPERDDLEFSFLMALGVPLLAVHGWSAPDVAETYERAYALGERAGDAGKLFASLRGVMNVLLLGGDLAGARRVAARLHAIATQRDDPALLLDAYRAVGMAAFFSGDFARARGDLARANAIYDRAAHHAHASLYGADPGVVGLSMAAWTECFLGKEEDAGDFARRALALAEELAHPFSLTYAEALAAAVWQTAARPEWAARHADRACALAIEHDYPYWQGWAKALRGWAEAHGGDAAAGIAMLEDGLQTYVATNARLIEPYLRALKADCLLQAGRLREAQSELAAARALAQETGVAFYDGRADGLAARLEQAWASGTGIARAAHQV